MVTVRWGENFHSVIWLWLPTRMESKRLVTGKAYGKAYGHHSKVFSISRFTDSIVFACVSISLHLTGSSDWF